MVTLYTIHCPQCNVIEKKLEKANIPFGIVEGIEPIRQLGFLSAPILKVEDKCMTFKEACEWIKEQQ